MTLTLSPSTPTEDLIRWSLEFLREHGYVCELPREWETPREFCSWVGIGSQTLTRRLRDPRRPHVDLIAGPSGRTKLIASNSRFDVFAKDGKENS